ncbi:hypothetical protein CRG98_011187 [Punica granatum]|uniref:Uncharacterized protein n=1 Tax=Punica granatum TaxID=22663 RepID=A0A2I0KJ93_PUNGR|nr:hypothetical protein CRG98_011187 [Punica granatum]
MSLAPFKSEKPYPTFLRLDLASSSLIELEGSRSGSRSSSSPLSILGYRVPQGLSKRGGEWASPLQPVECGHRERGKDPLGDEMGRSTQRRSRTRARRCHAPMGDSLVHTWWHVEPMEERVWNSWHSSGGVGLRIHHLA